MPSGNLFSKTRLSLSKKAAACCSAQTVRVGRTICTFPGREVFSATRMSRQKTNLNSFRRCGGELYEVFDNQKGLQNVSFAAP